MLLIDRLLVGGIKFVLTKIAAAVEAELDDDGAVREELLAAQMRLELGEIDEAAFAVIEAALLERLRAIQARRRDGEAEPQGALGGGVRVSGIELVGERHDVDGEGADES